MLALTQAGRAADAPPAPMGAYHVTAYVEVVPTATAQTAALMKAYRDVARKEPGATIVEVYQELGAPSRFVTREVWRDAQAADAHAKAASTSDLTGKLKSIEWRDATKPGSERASERETPNAIPLGGGVPIMVGNEVIGSVGVSGTRGGQEGDTAGAQAGADAAAAAVQRLQARN